MFKVLALLSCTHGKGIEGYVWGVAIQTLFSFYRHSLMLYLIIPTNDQDEGILSPLGRPDNGGLRLV